jgi:hypothetical protein
VLDNIGIHEQRNLRTSRFDVRILTFLILEVPFLPFLPVAVCWFRGSQRESLLSGPSPGGGQRQSVETPEPFQGYFPVSNRRMALAASLVSTASGVPFANSTNNFRASRVAIRSKTSTTRADRSCSPIQLVEVDGHPSDHGRDAGTSPRENLHEVGKRHARHTNHLLKCLRMPNRFLAPRFPFRQVKLPLQWILEDQFAAGPLSEALPPN